MAGLAGSVQVGGSSLLKLQQVLSHRSHPSHLHGICILAPMLLAGWSCYPPQKQWFLQNTPNRPTNAQMSTIIGLRLGWECPIPTNSGWRSIRKTRPTYIRRKSWKWKGYLKVLCIFTETLGPLKIDLTFVTSSGSSAPVVLLQRHPSTLASHGSFPLRNGASGHGGHVAAVALRHAGHLVATKDQLSFRNICAM